MRHTVALLSVLCLLFVTGCGDSQVNAPYEPITLNDPDETTALKNNAFLDYVELADQALKATDLSFDLKDNRVNREQLLSDMGSINERVATSTLKPFTFLHKASDPFKGGEHHEGWILLGKSLVWQIEDSLELAEWDEAVRWTIVATTFGIDLGGGDFSDASLGYGILYDTRRAIARHLPLIPQESLFALSEGLESAVGRWPAQAQTVRNEGQNMLLAVKSLQEAHQEGKIDDFADSLHGRSRNAVIGLIDLDDQQRSEFFRSLIQEQERVIDQLLISADLPGAQRSDVLYTLDGRARVVADQFFTMGNPWRKMHDRTQARTNLFATTVRIYSHIAEFGESPLDLSLFASQALLDPYTGRELNYEHQGRGFLLFSSGANGVHDQGETNKDRESPDLFLIDAVL